MADRDQSQASNRSFASMDEKKQRDIASKGGQNSGGNFANDPARAAEAGREGGHNVPDEERSFSKDRELASEAGRKRRRAQPRWACCRFRKRASWGPRKFRRGSRARVGGRPQGRRAQPRRAL